MFERKMYSVADNILLLYAANPFSDLDQIRHYAFMKSG